MDSLLELLKDTSGRRLALLEEELETLGRDALSYSDDFFSTKAKRYPASLFSHEKLFEISCSVLNHFKGFAKGDKPNDSYTNAADKDDPLWTSRALQDPSEVKKRLYTSLRQLEIYEQFLLWQLDIRHASTINRHLGLDEQYQQYLSNYRTKSQHFLDVREFLGHGISFEEAWIADRSLTLATMYEGGEKYLDLYGYFGAVEKWARYNSSIKQPPHLLPSPDEQDPWSTYLEFLHYHSLCQEASDDRVIALEMDMSSEWAILAQENLLQPTDTALSLVYRLEVQEDLPEANRALSYEKFLSSWKRLRQGTEVADYQSASLGWAWDMMDSFVGKS
ncbi:unnamed protein product [Clonostachys rhizophaga]|uniref:Uncharacterized protein n=1 Tax=Clonostachys rhizophaga TaxID=160324 RepID=A0A9N9VMW3_9HYPO|nr:unnamed protein product [Clonostachys rhizophaga]